MLSRIFDLMKQTNVKAVELSEKIKVSTGNITDWKNGKSKPSVDALIKIADYFQVSLDWLCGRAENSISHINLSKQPLLAHDDITELWQQLDDTQRQAILGTVRSLIAEKSKIEKAKK